jgi:hypothetical protein
MSELRASLSFDRTEPFMTIPETVLTFVGIPLGIIIVISLAALGPSAMRAPSRYRPGRPWPHQPAWYVPRPPGATPAPSHGSGHADVLAEHGPAITAGTGVAGASNAHAVGGASGEW